MVYSLVIQRHRTEGRGGTWSPTPLGKELDDEDEDDEDDDDDKVS